MVRRAAMVAIKPEMLPGSLEILRGFWRQLQLEVILRMAQAGRPVAPLSPAAIQRMLAMSGLPNLPAFDSFREAYHSELQGHPVDVKPFLPQLIELFAQLR